MLATKKRNFPFCCMCRHNHVVYKDEHKHSYSYFTYCKKCGAKRYSSNPYIARIKDTDGSSCNHCGHIQKGHNIMIYTPEYLIDHNIRQNREGYYIVTCPKGHTLRLKNTEHAVKVNTGEHKCRQCQFLKRSQRNLKRFPALKGEIWKPVKDFEAYYLVSNFGRVKNAENLILKPQTVSQGKYPAHFLYSPVAKGKLAYVHRLVATHFIKNPKQLGEANHKDFDHFNANYKNLEWISHQQNVIEAWKAGKHKINGINRKLTDENVKEIKANPDKPYAYWVEKFGIAKKTIYNIKSGHSWWYI